MKADNQNKIVQKIVLSYIFVKISYKILLGIPGPAARARPLAGGVPLASLPWRPGASPPPSEGVRARGAERRKSSGQGIARDPCGSVGRHIGYIKKNDLISKSQLNVKPS